MIYFSIDKCSICGEAAASFLGKEDDPILILCDRHDEVYTKSSQVRRGELVDQYRINFEERNKNEDKQK